MDPINGESDQTNGADAAAPRAANAQEMLERINQRTIAELKRALKEDPAIDLSKALREVNRKYPLRCTKYVQKPVRKGERLQLPCANIEVDVSSSRE